jgi:hypothetical protein
MRMTTMLPNLIFSSESYSTVCAVVGWEYRSLHSLSELISKRVSSQFTLFYYQEMSNLTLENRKSLQELAQSGRVAVEFVPLSYTDPISAWERINRECATARGRGGPFLVDVTTTPREAMWYIFDGLRPEEMKVDYVYWTPASYSKEWLSRDPARPRLLLRRGGVSEYGKRTLLALSTGYDTARAEQLILWFEPAQTVFFVQKGEQFNNRMSNIEVCDTLSRQYNIEMVPVDFYEPDCLSIMTEKLDIAIDEYNIILSLRGPKLSAICTYEYVLRNEQVALCYAPTNQINVE